jgi:glycosyltransferase involved in cell wall biosynthesis
LKILFIRSGNNGIDPISTNQGNSLIQAGVEIIYFDIVGKGVLGYFSNIRKLKQTIKKHKPEILHAHYSLSGTLCSLTFPDVPIVVSLMGSDVLSSSKWYKLILKISHLFWTSTIVKSLSIYNALSFKKNVHIIPNGVDTDIFQPMDQNTARINLGWDLKKKHILFAANPERKEKNYSLATKAISMIDSNEFDISLHSLVNIPYTEMITHYNAADLLLLTSLYEGSPNVIKEGMSCNCPIVSTDVGDVREVIGETEGCHITSFEPHEIAYQIKAVLARGKRTNGRNNINRLDRKIVAKKILDVYSSLLLVSSGKR